MYVGGVLNCGVETLQACFIGDPPSSTPTPKKVPTNWKFTYFLCWEVPSHGHFLGSKSQSENSSFQLGNMVRGLPLYHVRCVSLATWLGANQLGINWVSLVLWFSNLELVQMWVILWMGSYKFLFSLHVSDHFESLKV